MLIKNGHHSVGSTLGENSEPTSVMLDVEIRTVDVGFVDLCLGIYDRV
jgi:hypothetical protein